MQGRGTQTEPAGLAELRSHVSEFWEARRLEFVGQSAKEKEANRKGAQRSKEGSPYMFGRFISDHVRESTIPGQKNKPQKE